MKLASNLFWLSNCAYFFLLLTVVITVSWDTFVGAEEGSINRGSFPASTGLNSTVENTRTMCEICSKLIIKTPEQHHKISQFSLENTSQNSLENTCETLTKVFYCEFSEIFWRHSGVAFLTLNRPPAWFWCFHCWLWTDKCWLGQFLH